MIHYETINFLKEFKEIDSKNKIGYILKIAYITKYKDDYFFYDGWKFYNNRDRTSVDCIDGEILISSKYDFKNKNTEKQRHYMLIQTDFSIDKKYKTLMESDNDKKPLIDYIIENQLVEIKEVTELPVFFQFYDDDFVDVAEEIYEKIEHDATLYGIEDLKKILTDNLILSEKYPKIIKDSNENNMEKVLKDTKNRLLFRTELAIEKIFKYTNVNKMSIEDIVKYIKIGKENYYYDIRG